MEVAQVIVGWVRIGVAAAVICGDARGGVSRSTVRAFDAADALPAASTAFTV